MIKDVRCIYTTLSFEITSKSALSNNFTILLDKVMLELIGSEIKDTAKRARGGRAQHHPRPGVEPGRHGRVTVYNH